MQPQEPSPGNHNVEVGMRAPALPPRRKPPFLLICAAVLVLLIGGTGFWVIFHQKKAPASTPTPSPSMTALEKNLSSKQLALLKQVKDDFYLPQNLSVDQTTLEVIDDAGSATLNFNHNVKFGMGITAGSYGFIERPAGKSYNPPTNCGMPSEVTTSSPVACSLYGAWRGNKVYVYRGRGLDQITNTSVHEYENMYVQLGNQIIVIEAADTDPSKLFSVLQTMQKVSPRDLPADTQVYSNQ